MKHHSPTRLIAIAAAALLAAPGLAAPPERTFAPDPVELRAGRETPGKAELTVEYEGVEYRFATPENKAAFERAPADYAVADGGACARMGPLSGLGDARRYAVHDGRLYFFASDGCRAAFLQDPARHIEREDEQVFGSNDQVLRGRAALDRAVAWAGGVERLRAIRTYRAAAAREETHGDTLYAVKNETAIAFPNRYFQSESWNDSAFSTTSAPEGAAMASSRGVERIAASRGRAFERAMARWPAVILKAHADGAPGADCPGLIVVADGEGELDGTPVEYVKVWLNGAASRLTIEKGGGKLRQLAYHGRDGTTKVGDSVRTYTAYATVDGVTLPTAYTVSFDGAPRPASAATIDTFEIDPVLPEDRFAIPKE